MLDCLDRFLRLSHPATIIATIGVLVVLAAAGGFAGGRWAGARWAAGQPHAIEAHVGGG